MIYKLLSLFFKRKHKTPKAFGMASNAKIKKIIPINSSKEGVIYLSNSSKYITDLNYKLTSKKEIENFLLNDNTDFQRYRKEVNDCDNFAIQLAGKLNEAFPGFAVGYAMNLEHAFNIFIDHHEKLWIIEPQTDKVFISNSKKYKIEMVLM